MSAIDLLARAEVSSDLAHHEYQCDVDILGAVGLAAIQNPPHMSIFRLKYLNDTNELEAAKRLFITWARAAMLRRQLDPSGMPASPGKATVQSASRMGVQALTLWLDDVCHTCHGRKYEVPEGAPALSDRTCPVCGGTGKTPIKHQQIEVVKDLHDRADAAVRYIQSGIDGKLGRG